jgi:hypothetical protein
MQGKETQPGKQKGGGPERHGPETPQIVKERRMSDAMQAFVQGLEIQEGEPPDSCHLEVEFKDFEDKKGKVCLHCVGKCDPEDRCSLFKVSERGKPTRAFCRCYHKVPGKVPPQIVCEDDFTKTLGGQLEAGVAALPDGIPRPDCHMEVLISTDEITFKCVGTCAKQGEICKLFKRGELTDKSKLRIFLFCKCEKGDDPDKQQITLKRK